MIYRLYTEDENRQEIFAIVTKYFQGFTVFYGNGFWKTKKENSLVIEIVTSENFINIKQICEEIKTLNKQTSVLVVKIHSESEFI